MARIEFGLSLGSMSTIPSFARNAEVMGFDYLTCGEHLMFHGPIGNSLIALAGAATVTQKIKLMSTIVLVPLYGGAAMLAKMTAVLDVVSGGRYHFGIGVGGEFPREFEAAGVPVKERGPRTNEALEVITRLWTEKKVTFSGRFHNFREVTIDPPPVQKPHPPIWVAGRQESAMKRAAKFAQGWLPYMYTPEQLSNSIEKIKEFGSRNGRDMSAFHNGLFIFTSVYKDRDKAREVAARQVGSNYAQDFSQKAGRYLLFGTPEDCVKRLKEYVSAGARTVVIANACPREDLDSNLKLISEEILPAFR
ncbi:MAG TPA: LLM class flavin-dependent oxidoreductase [Candidatus Binataceae bacterium]|nr:LLM class flavin-dependent oxidoreductase [Candidatus Binataceae bacterium]